MSEETKLFTEAPSGKWIVEAGELKAVGGVNGVLPKRKDYKGFTIVGTSGSMDYLKDATADRRYWPVKVDPPPSPLPLPEDRWCDGVHDEAAPTHYLCTLCYQDLIERALKGMEDPVFDELQHDDTEEID